jgi:hypothetical protein
MKTSIIHSMQGTQFELFPLAPSLTMTQMTVEQETGLYHSWGAMCPLMM